MHIETRIIRGTATYAQIKYAGTFGTFPNDAHHCGTVDFLLRASCSESDALMRVAQECREKAARALRHAAIAEAAAAELAAKRSEKTECTSIT